MGSLEKTLKRATHAVSKEESSQGIICEVKIGVRIKEDMKLKELFSFSSRHSSVQGPGYSGKKDFNSQYSMKEQIGKGGFGVVFSAVRRRDGLEVAVKQVSKDERVVMGADTIPLEVALMQQLQDVPGVIRLIDYFDMQDCFYIVMERFHSKDMFDFISEQGPLPENLARNLFKQLVDTVITCHQRGIMHRDIKDENILIDLNPFKIKLIDFGSGGFIEPRIYHEFQGTRVYSSPEWIRDRCYQPEGLTVWSLGILLYDMLCGDVPFECDQEIMRAHLTWFLQLRLSTEAMDLVQACLTINPEDRISLKEIQNHPWISAKDIPKPGRQHRAGENEDYSYTSVSHSSTSSSSSSSDESLLCSL